jgi:predicted membrane channel-forming protein YqfA (hemolysin III family)
MRSDDVSNKVLMWVLASAVVFVLAALMIIVQAAGSGNMRYDRSDAALYCVHSDQCERPASDKPIAEIQNTLSNLAYLFFGICVLVRAFRPGAPAAARPGPVMFGAALCFLAVCSAYYHGTLNHVGTVGVGGALRAVNPANGSCPASLPHSDAPQLLDIVGVYLALIMLFLHGIDRLLWKNIAAASTGSKTAAALGGLVFVLLAVVAALVAGGGVAMAVGLPFMLVILAAFVLAGNVAGDKDVHWLKWTIWIVCALIVAFLSVLMKSSLHWDSTAIFASMAVLLAGALAVNWLFAANPPPWPEFVVLTAVFLFGIAPRLLDGYDWDQPAMQLFRKGFCSPDGFVQAHAMWHVISALALALTYDLLEKSIRGGREGSPGTVLLPPDNALSDALRVPLRKQSPGAIVFNVLFSGAAVLLLVVALANREHSGAVWALGFAPLAAAIALWVWPLLSPTAA